MYGGENEIKLAEGWQRKHAQGCHCRAVTSCSQRAARQVWGMSRVRGCSISSQIALGFSFCPGGQLQDLVKKRGTVTPSPKGGQLFAAMHRGQCHGTDVFHVSLLTLCKQQHRAKTPLLAALLLLLPSLLSPS